MPVKGRSGSGPPISSKENMQPFSCPPDWTRVTHKFAMKWMVLLCLLGSLRLRRAVPLEGLEKFSMDFFTNNSMLLAATLSTSFLVNIPKCVSSSKFSLDKVRVAVAQLPDATTPAGVLDTEEIQNLRKTPQTTKYFAAEFKSALCSITRDLVVMDTANSQYELSTVLGFQVGGEFCHQTKGPFCNQALKPSTFYRVNFFLLDDKSEIRGHTDWSPAIQTRNVTNYDLADVAFAGRAGGMIVITILVSVGGFILVTALTAAVTLKK